MKHCAHCGRQYNEHVLIKQPWLQLPLPFNLEPVPGFERVPLLTRRLSRIQTSQRTNSSVHQPHSHRHLLEPLWRQPSGRHWWLALPPANPSRDSLLHTKQKRPRGVFVFSNFGKLLKRDLGSSFLKLSLKSLGILLLHALLHY